MTKDSGCSQGSRFFGFSQPLFSPMIEQVFISGA